MQRYNLLGGENAELQIFSHTPPHHAEWLIRGDRQ